VGGHLSTQAIVVASLAALGFIAVVIELIRRHRIQERYSVLWIATGIGMLLGAVFNNFVNVLARAAGIADARFALILLLILFIFGILLHLTTVISRLSEQNVRLAQELAIVRAELDAAPGAAPEESAAAARQQLVGS
jgi:hypothetical protein